jgi:hypothetical protein
MHVSDQRRRSRDSSVGVVTRLKAGQESSIAFRAERYFSSPKCQLYVIWNDLSQRCERMPRSEGEHNSKYVL